ADYRLSASWPTRQVLAYPPRHHWHYGWAVCHLPALRQHRGFRLDSSYVADSSRHRVSAERLRPSRRGISLDDWPRRCPVHHRWRRVLGQSWLSCPWVHCLSGDLCSGVGNFPSYYRHSYPQRSRALLIPALWGTLDYDKHEGQSDAPDWPSFMPVPT